MIQLVFIVNIAFHAFLIFFVQLIVLEISHALLPYLFALDGIFSFQIYPRYVNKLYVTQLKTGSPSSKTIQNLAQSCKKNLDVLDYLGKKRPPSYSLIDTINYRRLYLANNMKFWLLKMEPT